MKDPRRYGVDLCYGTCMIDRCLETIQYWEEGLDGSALFKKVITEASIPGTKHSTYEHFVREFFSHRFLTQEGLMWTRVLKRYAHIMSRACIVQIMYLLSARFDPMIRDFVLTTYWPRVKKGEFLFPSSTAFDFLVAAAQEGRPGAIGSECSLKKNSSGINGICLGYGLWRRQNKNGYLATPIIVHSNVIPLLACELHDRGLSDEAVISHLDWALLGMNREDVLAELRSSRFTNVFLCQSNSNLVSISWKMTMMEAAARYGK